MRETRIIACVLVLVLIILLGTNYPTSNSYTTDSEAYAQSNKESASSKLENQPTPVADKPPAAEQQVSSAEPASPLPQQNEVDLDHPAQSRYIIDVSVSDQKVRIFENDKIIKEWVVSTGQNDSTPLGRFEIQNRGVWFFSEKYQEGAMWWVSFKDWGTYLFHSLPMDSEQNIITEEANKLGSPASHGCVRLELDNAKWIYDNIPQGTDVYIHS